MILGHVSGVPVEELVPLAGGTGGALIVLRVWISIRFRERLER